MGIIAKGAKCNVSDCNNDGFRSLNTKKVEEAGLRVSVSGKKAALCKEHYKEWKKETKEDRSLDRARFDIYYKILLQCLFIIIFSSILINSFFQIIII